MIKTRYLPKLSIGIFLPETTKQIKGFLDLLDYNPQFIKNITKNNKNKELTKPFTKWVKDSAKIEMINEYLSCS